MLLRDSGLFRRFCAMFHGHLPGHQTLLSAVRVPGKRALRPLLRLVHVYVFALQEESSLHPRANL